MSASISENRRRFGLFDTMIVIAGIASAFGICRALRPAWPEFLAYPSTPRSLVYLHRIRYGEAYLIPFLVSATIAHVLMRFRHPRPPREQWMSYAGSVASVAAASVIALQLVGSLLLWLIGTRADFLPNP